MLCFYCCSVILHQLVLGGASLRQKEEVGEVGGREGESVFVCVSMCSGKCVCFCLLSSIYSNVIVTLGQLVLLISHRHLPCVEACMCFCVSVCVCVYSLCVCVHMYVYHQVYSIDVQYGLLGNW